MADNVDVTPGSGKTFATDDIDGVQYPRVKISQGADGSATDVSSNAPLQVTLANTGANTNKLLVTPDLPTGASTAAKQPALGTAGTASSDVITVQGISGMTAVKVDGSNVTQPISGTVTANLASGTNGIGKLTANSGVTIGAVEIAAAQTLGTVTTVTTVSALTGGGIAHDGVDSGNPIKTGAKAKSTLSGVTLVSSDDRADSTSDLDGAHIVRNNFALGDLVNGNASNTDGSSTQVLAAGAAGIKHYITDVTITNTSASNIYVELKDGTTVKWTFPVPANGGVTHHFASPIGGTAATAWNFDPSAAATTIYCSVSGFKSKI